MILKIDGTDFSPFVSKYGYSVRYNKIKGSNDVTTMDGTLHEDILARKAIVNVQLNPMTSEDLASLENAIQRDYCLVTFYDTASGENKTTNMRCQLNNAEVVLNKLTGLYWGAGNTGAVLNMEEV